METLSRKHDSPVCYAVALVSVSNSEFSEIKSTASFCAYCITSEKVDQDSL